ncbi:Na+/H+ antiporter subunit E [Roseicyclus sp. F158]|uniref:Na+/H+ antiporter subunit E n=1 Tax=Tropicimonas omnivorans TaxID=3075590 RepID=A0ABU3DI29_9RHOB|nr:Na+/H+ antiporter subunit E [Roseicyclus sp. F158]MDT0683366.1 Na+/H+ antiporter subunit E [Roseicyclus sp. F158]
MAYTVGPKYLPHPQLTLLLTVIWLMLNNTITLGNILLGLILGLVIPIITRPYWQNKPVIRSRSRFIGYMFVVLWDIVVANVVVAYTILFKSNARMQSGWVAVPLELTQPEAITILAGTITMTPGTVTAMLAADGHTLLIHYLDAPDPESVRDEIKSRYERRLLEIFE